MSRCEHCQFFQTLTVQGPNWGDRLIGHCKRFPPTPGRPTPLKDEVTRADLSQFPLVRANEWCGEFRPTTTEFRRTSAFTMSPKPKVQGLRILVSSGEAAKMMGVCEKSLYHLSRSGHLPVVRVGRRVCYCIETLKSWVAAHEH
jgi:excisionase family DNA binding protein